MKQTLIFFLPISLSIARELIESLSLLEKLAPCLVGCRISGQCLRLTTSGQLSPSKYAEAAKC